MRIREALDGVLLSTHSLGHDRIQMRDEPKLPSLFWSKIFQQFTQKLLTPFIVFVVDRQEVTQRRTVKFVHRGFIPEFEYSRTCELRDSTRVLGHVCESCRASTHFEVS